MGIVSIVLIIRQHIDNLAIVRWSSNITTPIQLLSDKSDANKNNGS